MPDIKYEIIRKIGVLSKASSGWTKELNLISWNEMTPFPSFPQIEVRIYPLQGATRGE